MITRGVSIPRTSAGKPSVLEVAVPVPSDATPGGPMRAAIPPSGSYRTGAMRQAAVWIDDAPEMVSLRPIRRSFREGAPVLFTLQRAGAAASELGVRLRVTVTGGVLAGTTSFGATLPTGSGDSYTVEVDASIPRGSSSLRLRFDTDDDSVAGPPGTVTVELLRRAQCVLRHRPVPP